MLTDARAVALDRLKREMGSSAYATKPRLSGLGYRHSKAGGSSHGSVSGDKENTYGKSKKPKTRRSNSKMADYGLRRLPDYTDLAYKEAVSKLKYFLTDNYAPSVRSGGASIKNLDESDDNLDVVSKSRYPISVYPPSAQYRRIRPLAMKYPYYTWDTNSYGSAGNINTTGLTDGIQNPVLDKPSTSSPEIMNFMQKQEDYIEQLERESQYCRDELTSLLGKVKEVITENEHLHEVQKNSLISNVFNQFRNGRAAGAGGASETDELDDTNSNACDSDGKFSSYKRGGSYSKPSRLEGPNIVFESRISELEAQLTQSKIDLKKVQDENSENRRRVSEGIVDSSYMDGFKRQVDNLQRDKSALELQVAKLKAALEQHGDCEKDVASRVRRSTEMVEEQLRSERGNLEADIRRLKEELSLLKSRSRDERGLVERRHTGQVEQLQHDLNAQWDTTTKLQLELEKQRREESDLKREISQKNAHIEDLKLELRNKIASLQADIAQSHAEKASQDEELANARLLIERHQRQAKHDTNRLNSEVQSLRQRLDRADADLVHSRRENLRLTEQLANAEKDVHLRSLRPQSPLVKENTDKDISSKIQDIESKHARTVQELETLVRSQNSLMDKLTGECRLLTRKLEDSGRKHKWTANQSTASAANQQARCADAGKAAKRKRVRFVD